MRTPSLGLACLIAGYTLSQFYRAFLAVLAPTLKAELGATPGDLALASGVWFLTFALAQLPIGWALDAVGPRRTSAVLLALGGAGGAAVFALATAPWHLTVAMALIGLGCAPVLMAAYYLLGRLWPAERFGALAGLVVALGSLGNILGASPLVAAIDAFGWRQTLWGLVAVTLAVALAIAALARDPAPVARGGEGRLADLLHLRGLWWLVPIIFVSYAASAAIRGVWVGPYLSEVQGADAQAIGRATLVMGLAMVAGNLLAGRAIRLAGGARAAALWGNGIALAALVALALWPGMPWAAAVAALAVIGAAGTNYALLMAHGRTFLPPQLLGYGITALNMISIAGVGVMQFATRPLYALTASDPAQTFARIFAAFAVTLAIGLALYLGSRHAPR